MASDDATSFVWRIAPRSTAISPTAVSRSATCDRTASMFTAMMRSEFADMPSRAAMRCTKSLAEEAAAAEKKRAKRAKKKKIAATKLSFGDDEEEDG